MTSNVKYGKFLLSYSQFQVLDNVTKDVFAEQCDVKL